ncbi:unnamed protein product [Gongylonema pulchrum]|uniref:NOT2_3_5 domain-containing protein n=1 Tax=Gongylonema pulchrum TaxID=637853 RepID=A0A183D118_9BILA|nr:unnamed protein product [Gongylonema pulchrum]
MVRYERSVEALLDSDFDHNFFLFENLRYHFGNPSVFLNSSFCDLYNLQWYRPNRDGFTELYAWVGHTGVTYHNSPLHRFLKLEYTESLAEQSASVFEFSVVIRIH